MPRRNRRDSPGGTWGRKSGASKGHPLTPIGDWHETVTPKLVSEEGRARKGRHTRQKGVSQYLGRWVLPGEALRMLNTLKATLVERVDGFKPAPYPLGILYLSDAQLLSPDVSRSSVNSNVQAVENMEEVRATLTAAYPTAYEDMTVYGRIAPATKKAGKNKRCGVVLRVAAEPEGLTLPSAMIDESVFVRTWFATNIRALPGVLASAAPRIITLGVVAAYEQVMPLLAELSPDIPPIPLGPPRVVRVQGA